MNDSIRQLTHSDISDTVKLFQTSFQHDHMYDEYGLDVNQKLQTFTDCIVYAINYGQSFGVYQNNELISFLLGFDYHKGFQENPAAMATVSASMNKASVYTKNYPLSLKKPKSMPICITS